MPDRRAIAPAEARGHAVGSVDVEGGSPDVDEGVTLAVALHLRVPGAVGRILVLAGRGKEEEKGEDDVHVTCPS